ncbi:MAG: flap endonuclease, partial [Nocardioidaceae bacterium]|nr:flap endonuclease [Nocardioidaceae bacterium]
GVSRHERITDAVVRDKYGVAPGQYADFATLRGDASDGLPGVAGVGEKTAASLLRKFGDLAGIVAAVDDPEAEVAPGLRTKITAAADYLAVAPEVVAVARDLDLGDVDTTLPSTPDDHAAVIQLSERWGLDSPLARLVETMTTVAHDS